MFVTERKIMKHFHVLLGVIFLSLTLLLQTKSLSAQEYKLSAAANALIEASANGFTEIRGAKAYEKGDTVIYASRIIITGSKQNYVKTIGNVATWICDYGTFPSRQEAVNRIREIGNEFTALQAAAGLQENEVSLSGLPYFTLKVTSEKAVVYYNAIFVVLINSDARFQVIFRIPEKCRKYDYYLLTNDPVDSPFGSDLHRLIDESKNEFKNIRGEAISGSFLQKYAAKLKIAGAGDAEIIDRMISTVYKAYFAVNQPEEAVTKGLDTLLNGVAASLGKEYVWSKTPEQDGATFTRKTETEASDRAVVEIRKEKGANGFNMYLQVNSPPLF